MAGGGVARSDPVRDAIFSGLLYFGECPVGPAPAIGPAERGHCQKMTKRIILLVLAGIASLCAQSSSRKAPPQKPKTATVNYFRDIEPILTANCVACHQAAMAAGGLRVDAPENVLQGGASGPSVIPRNAQRSLLYTRLTDTTAKRMPPAGTLSEEQLALIRAWINLGAKIEPLPKTSPAKR